MKDSSKLLGFDINRDLVFDSRRRLTFNLDRRLLFNLDRGLNFDLDRDLEIRQRGVVFRGYVCPICGGVVAKDAANCNECGVKFHQDRSKKTDKKKKRQSWDTKKKAGEHAVEGTRGGSQGIVKHIEEAVQKTPEEPPEDESAEAKFRHGFSRHECPPGEEQRVVERPPPPPPPMQAAPPPPPPPSRRNIFQCSNCGKVLYVGTKQCTSCGALYGTPVTSNGSTQRAGEPKNHQNNRANKASRSNTVSWADYQKKDRKEGIVSWEDYIKNKSS